MGHGFYAAVGRKSFLASLMLQAQLGGNSEAAKLINRPRAA
jgi:hypothetical protein